VISKFLKIIFFPVALFLILVIFILRKLILIRFGLIHTERFGHLIANFEIYNIERNNYPKECKKTIDVFSFSGRFGNSVIKKKIKRKILFAPNFFGQLLYQLLKTINLRKHLISDYSWGYDIYNLVYKHKSSIQLTSDEEFKGQSILHKIFDKKKKLVALYMRDYTFNQSMFKNEKNIHEYRNSNIDDYNLVLNYLSQNNYQVVRLGRKFSQKMKEDVNLYDYAFSEKQSDLLDIYIPSKIDFFISTNTGVEVPATHIFKKKGLYVNLLPYGAIHHCRWVPYSVLLFKKIYKNNKLMSIKDIFMFEVMNFDKTEQYENLNLKIIDNSPEEILEATKEFIEYRKNKIFKYKNEEDARLQKKFWNIYKENFNFDKKNSYIIFYKNNFVFEHDMSTCIVSPSFLRNNPSFLN
jgi:putative glycosyltransferase (TIGR04372 family)